MPTNQKEWTQRWNLEERRLSSSPDDPRDVVIRDKTGELIIDESDHGADQTSALEEEIVELLATNRALQAENEHLKLQLKQQQPIVKDFEKRAKTLITEFEPFIQQIKGLIDVILATDTSNPFWNIPIDAMVVKIHHFCIVNSEMLSLMYNCTHFERGVKKYIEVIEAVHSSLISHKLENQQGVTFLLIDLYQALQILDLD